MCFCRLTDCLFAFAIAFAIFLPCCRMVLASHWSTRLSGRVKDECKNLMPIALHTGRSAGQTLCLQVVAPGTTLGTLNRVAPEYLYLSENSEPPNRLEKNTPVLFGGLHCSRLQYSLPTSDHLKQNSFNLVYILAVTHVPTAFP